MIPHEVVEKAVAAHLPGARLVRVLPGGSANLTTQVRTSTGDMVLRVYLRPDHRRFECEIETLVRLAGIGATTPRPQRWGRECPVFGTPFVLYPMLPGEPLTRAARYLDASGVARVVARLMTTAFDCASKLPATGHGYLDRAAVHPAHRGLHHVVGEYAKAIAHYRLIPRGLLAAAVDAVEAHAHTVMADHPCLVHPDLKPDNVLVDGDRVAIVDWEMPVGGHPALSYGGLLAEGLAQPRLQDGLRLHLAGLDPDTRLAALTAGLLRCLEVPIYLPGDPPVQDGRKLRADAKDLAESIDVLLDWTPR